MSAGYDGLLPAQQQWFDRLMSAPISEWPEDLRQHVAEARPHCGDEIADAVGVWVNQQRD